ncbi:MAG: hypothetical protein DI536_22820 [Archangium gephyra]|uniref:Uncharacterized protein n=1 Tax=Archangium gephyra TaxID=48 RepID=A0A2W5TCF4_9BACT|nr:MAG: hypothetical protein DI536_22820 [Archangium gephyra]
MQRMWMTLVALSLLSDVPPRRVAPPAVECRQDSECVISTFRGCCPACCEPPPRAVKKGTKEGDVCMAMLCEEPDCSTVRCAKPAAATAVCRQHRCVAVELPSNAQCRVDTDCKVVDVPTANGCCTERRAVPLDTPAPLSRDTKKGERFGLSTPTAPQACGPCPATTGGEAVCSAGRCELRRVEKR